MQFLHGRRRGNLLLIKRKRTAVRLARCAVVGCSWFWRGGRGERKGDDIREEENVAAKFKQAREEVGLFGNFLKAPCGVLMHSRWGKCCICTIIDFAMLPCSNRMDCNGPLARRAEPSRKTPRPSCDLGRTCHFRIKQEESSPCPSPKPR